MEFLTIQTSSFIFIMIDKQRNSDFIHRTSLTSTRTHVVLMQFCKQKTATTEVYIELKLKIKINLYGGL